MCKQKGGFSLRGLPAMFKPEIGDLRQRVSPIIRTLCVPTTTHENIKVGLDHRISIKPFDHIRGKGNVASGFRASSVERHQVTVHTRRQFRPKTGCVTSNSQGPRSAETAAQQGNAALCCHNTQVPHKVHRSSNPESAGQTPGSNSGMPWSYASAIGGLGET